MEQTKPSRRIAICGTAPTWKETPWDDPTLEIWLLNDMHVMAPPRADRWFDLHPFRQMYFHQGTGKLEAGKVPPGMFVRPEGHLEWLKRQSIPVYVQAEDATFPGAVPFPKEAIEAKFGPYFASSPAWMVGLALLEGVTELHIYGIHLATEWEYVRQRPNMAFLLGLAVGSGVKVVLPKGCPLLRESHQYGFAPDPDLPKLKLQRQIAQWQAQQAPLRAQTRRRWYQRRDPNAASRLAWLDAQIRDASLGIQQVIVGRPPVGG